MYIEGVVVSVLECLYKEGEVWCELELETSDSNKYTVMIPTEVYKNTKKEVLKENAHIHIHGIVLESSLFVIAWHIALSRGHIENLVLEM